MSLWTNRRFGIELECNTVRRNGTRLTQQEMGDAITAALNNLRNPRPVRVAGYTHSNGESWDVKTDGSCGWEVSSPALTFDENGNNAELTDCVQALMALQPQVNAQCGYHIHVECRDYTWRDLQKLLAFWTRYEPYFFDLCPNNRRRNQYTVPLRAATWAGRAARNHWQTVRAMLETTDEQAFRSIGQRNLGKYQSLNLNHWWQHGRVEFRLQAGTMNPVKVAQWARLMTSLVSRVKAETLPAIEVTANEVPVRRPVTTRYMMQVLGFVGGLLMTTTQTAVAEGLERWMTERRAHFGSTVDTNAVTVATGAALTVGQRAALTRRLNAEARALGTLAAPAAPAAPTGILPEALANMTPQQRAWVTRRARQRAAARGLAGEE